MRCASLRRLMKKGSVDLGYHTRCHTRYTLGTHRVPTHANTRKHHHTQTAPRRTRARSHEISHLPLVAARHEGPEAHSRSRVTRGGRQAALATATPSRDRAPAAEASHVMLAALDLRARRGVLTLRGRGRQRGPRERGRRGGPLLRRRRRGGRRRGRGRADGERPGGAARLERGEAAVHLVRGEGGAG